MVNTILLGSALVAAVTVSAMPGMESEFNFGGLLKRQQPGTPAYNCHDNCGQVIIQNRQLGEALCSGAAFQSNYKNCLQCAGPDNYGIWSMYGNSVSAAGTKCGLSTTPLSGKQPEVGPAQYVSASTTTSAAPATTTTSARQTTTTTTGGGGGSGGGGSSSSTRTSSSSSVAATSSGVSSTSRATSASSASSSGSGSTTARPSTTGGSGSSNGTAPNPRPTVTAGAVRHVAGVFGAIVALGAAFVAL